MLTDKERAAIVALAMKLQGVPYIWGGSSPMQGFDCSGFCIWILQPFDILPSGDWTAGGLARVFPTRVHTAKPGDLVFYGPDPQAITHVMLAISETLCIGASGGDSSTTTAEEAKRRGAKVKVKGIQYRRDLQFIASIEDVRL